MKKMFLALSALVLLVSSCSKDKDDESGPITPTKENLTGTYKLTKVVLTANGQTSDMTTQYMQFFDACQRDDVFKLNADNTYQWVDAGTKCDPEGGYTDTWSLTSNTTIVMDGETYTIKSFNGKILEVSQSYGGAEQVETYTKQ